MMTHMLMVSGAGALVGTMLRRTERKTGVLALAYHRIGNAARGGFDPDVFSATPEGFEQQIKLLKKDYDVITPAELSQAAKRGRGSYALITFDDGYRDNYEVAFPILKAQNVPATFFISTGFLDQHKIAWWDEIAWMVRASRRRLVPRSRWNHSAVFFDEPDRLEAIRAILGIYKRLPGDHTDAFMDYLADATGSGRYAGDARNIWMTWDMVRDMAAGGMCIGGHTVNHPILSRLPRTRQSEEIAGCKQRIEQEINRPMKFFSYPRGKPDSFTDETRHCLREQAIELAFSYYGGFQSFDAWQPYDIHRVGVEMDTTPDHFASVVAMPWLFA